MMVTGATMVAVMPLRYRKILGDRKSDALILGGTELPLLIRDASIGVPLLDTTRIHVERALAELLS